MGKFIVSEEEKNRIRSLYEQSTNGISYQDKYNTPIGSSDPDSIPNKIGNLPQKTIDMPYNSGRITPKPKPKQTWRKNENFPLMPWDLSSKIAVIQKALNLPPVQQKGYFGNITINALREAGFDVRKGIDELLYNKILEHFGGGKPSYKQDEEPGAPSYNETPMKSSADRAKPSMASLVTPKTYTHPEEQ